MRQFEIKWAVFDYGGVLAEEGFVAGLKAIAEQENLDPDTLFESTRDLIHDTGYLTGKVLEETFWREFRKQTGIQRTDDDLRNQILSRFKIRPWMLDIVQELKKAEINTAILSDQVNWLDELDVRDDFFKYFDRVYNSFHVGLSKIETDIFDELITWLNASPAEILFVDDHPGHTRRAESRGLQTIHYQDRQGFTVRLSQLCPTITSA
ncbi:HAD family hydrolase [Desulfonatronovibrio magnus]|uniref:HAD family hydrolase n=1 Tax=Desulfonatronovibrio magnus TaxID=698827 RepID=UPI0005EB2F82|nr:HAD family phosphatase [Desulfonatronovibrio magnus]